MRNHEWGGAYSENSSDTESIASERTAFSGPLPLNAAPFSNKRGSIKSAIFNLPPEITTMPNFAAEDDEDEGYVEITLDIRDDSVAVHSVQGGNEDPELALLAMRTMENKSASLCSSLFSNTSARIKQVSQEQKRVVSRRSSNGKIDRTKSAAAHALKGLKFITSKTGACGNGWSFVEKRFNDLTSSTNGLLHRSQFAECIGISFLIQNQTKIAKYCFVVFLYEFSWFMMCRDEPVKRVCRRDVSSTGSTA